MPPSIIIFLSVSCQLPEDASDQLWEILKGVVWDGTDILQNDSEDMFLKHGHPHGLSKCLFIPSVNDLTHLFCYISFRHCILSGRH